MKKLKLILILFAVSALIFQSCSSNEDSLEIEKSSALRMFLREMKVANNISGRTSSDDSNMCFEFVYPLTLSYNNGTTITVSSQVELFSILENETDVLYIEGISFPFDIIVAGSTSPITITSEEGFWNIIQACDMDTYDDIIGEGPCYTFVYPFSLMTINNQVIVISSEEALYNLIDDDNQDNYIIDFVYPFSVLSNNETIQINNSYEYEQLINNCVSSNCNCPDVYEPVCVNIGGQVIEFPNACNAECAGFSSDDFVDCTNNGNNDTFDNILDSCLNISYPVQVQYNGAVATAQNDNDLLQLYTPNQNHLPLFNYPIIVSFDDNPSETYSILNEESFIELINLHCN
jgi:hypothetical protein